ncbi:MAG: response regulator transcription factor [Clostridiales bacterium]|nr:response regulator transcription factor [Clostridiales bacterium]MBR2869817.1 response regulator transcription factor [Clostridia bacterium]
MNNPLILIVEDDAPIRNLITTTLKAHEYKYLTAQNGENAIMQASSHNPDIVLLDLGLPDIDGIEVIKKIRTWSEMPIIVISARSEDNDKIEALDAGADDYLTKPFSVEELLARIRVTTRRLSVLHSAMQSDSLFTNGNLKIDYAAGCAYINDNELHLTPIEYKLLCLLSQNVGKVLTHTFITQKIWGAAWESNVASLRVFMATLRKKIEIEPDSPQYIQTHIGVGYRMMRIE